MMKFTSSQVEFALVKAAVAMTIMWLCVIIISMARFYAVSETALNHAFGFGIAMPILGVPGLVTLWAMIKEFRMTIAAQQTQIDDLKHEWESRKTL